MKKKKQQKSEKGNGFGIAGFFFGILSVVFLIIPPLVLVFGVLGIIFSSIQLTTKRTKLAIIGLILSILTILGILIFVFSMVYIIVNSPETLDADFIAGLNEIIANFSEVS